MTEAYDGWQVVGMDLHRHDRPSARPRPPAILAPPSGAGQPNILFPARTSGPARGDAHNRIQVNPPRAFPQASIIGYARDPAITEQLRVLSQRQLLRVAIDEIVHAAWAYHPPGQPPWPLRNPGEAVDTPMLVRYFT